MMQSVASPSPCAAARRLASYGARPRPAGAELAARQQRAAATRGTLAAARTARGAPGRARRFAARSAAVRALVDAAADRFATYARRAEATHSDGDGGVVEALLAAINASVAAARGVRGIAASLNGPATATVVAAASAAAAAAAAADAASLRGTGGKPAWPWSLVLAEGGDDWPWQLATSNDFTRGSGGADHGPVRARYARSYLYTSRPRPRASRVALEARLGRAARERIARAGDAAAFLAAAAAVRDARRVVHAMEAELDAAEGARATERRQAAAAARRTARWRVCVRAARAGTNSGCRCVLCA